MMKTVLRFWLSGFRSSARQCILYFPKVGISHQKTSRGFTLIETLVAVSLLAVVIVAPMSLTTQSLSSAYYARDQMTAFHLAQEAIESVRSVRDEIF